MDDTKSQKLNTALKTWCKGQGISAPNLGRRIGYTEQHAYRLLNGAVPVTAETIGRFVLTFGPDATRAWLELAGLQTHAVEILPRPAAAAQVVPVITLRQA